MNKYLRDRANRRGMIQNQGRGQGQERMDRHYPHYPRRTMREMERMQMQQYHQQYPMDMRYGQSIPMDYNYGNTERDGRYNDRNYSMPMDTRYDMAYQQYRQPSRPMDFAMYGYGIGGIRPMNYDYGYDYASEDMEKEWKEHLKKWQEELKRYDRFNMPKDQVIQNARQMGVEFDKYNEEEFLTTYYMVMSDYPSIANEPHTYISLAKDWLEDEDSKLKGSEKLSAYYYEVINAGEED